MLGISGFRGLSGEGRGLVAVQPGSAGAELPYLLRHDPQFRSVRREHLVEAGKRVRLKHDVALLAKILSGDLDGNRFQFFVISAGSRDLVQSALAGIVPAEHIFGTEFDYDPSTGEIASILRAPAGYGTTGTKSTPTG